MIRISPLCVGPLMLAVLCIACSKDSPVSPESATPSALLEAGQSSAARSVIVQTDELDFGVDGSVDVTFTTTTAYDGRGNPVSLLVESESASGQSQVRRSAAVEYNTHGDLIAAIQDDDTNLDGTIDTRLIVSTIETNGQGHPIRQTRSEDRHLDGTVDSQSEFSIEYDARGRILGTSSDTGTGSYEYDAHDNVLRFISQGSVAPITRLEESTEYSVHDAVLHDLLIITRGVHRPAVYTLTTTAVDGQGYPTVQTRTLADGSQVIDRSVLSITYDGHHRPLTVVENDDANLDGVADARFTSRFDYLGAELEAAHGRPAGRGPGLDALEARQGGLRNLIAGAAQSRLRQ